MSIKNSDRIIENAVNPSQEKPRRLEDETAHYLQQIEIQWNAITQSHQTDSHGSFETKKIIVSNVMEEISTRTASAACDRRTHFLFEQLCALLSPSELLTLLQKWSPYTVFLARNRFASHIVQTILSRLSFFLSTYDSQREWDANTMEDQLSPSQFEEMEIIVLSIAKPLLKEINWLGKEMSASHVLRSLISLLCGLPPIAERKGKNSKHHHSVLMAEHLDNMVEPGNFYISESKSFTVPGSFKQALLEGVELLLLKSSRDLQLLAADTSSNALLTLLIRILAHPNRFPDKAGLILVQRIFSNILEISIVASDEESVEKISTDVFYGMAGDKSASYFLETLCECSSIPFLLQLVHGNIVGSLYAYLDDNYGNFVVQAVLRRLSSELSKRASSSDSEVLDKKKKKKTKEFRLWEDIDRLLITLLEEFLENADKRGEVLKSKGGVIYWLLGAAQFISDDSWATTIAELLLEYWDTQDLSLKLTTKPEPIDKEDVNSNKEVVSVRPSLPDSQQLLLCRLIGAMLRSRSKEIQSKAAKVVISLNTEALKVMATSGPMSKAVLDVFFEEFSSAQELKTLGMGLVALAGDLAGHFVGQHVVKNIYQRSDLRGKEKWATTISALKMTLTKTKEGRASLVLVNADLYSKDAAEWRAAVKKQMKASEMLSGITLSGTAMIGEEGPSKVSIEVTKTAMTDKPINGNHGEVKGPLDDLDNEEGKASHSRKRKRKRPQKGASDA